MKEATSRGAQRDSKKGGREMKIVYIVLCTLSINGMMNAIDGIPAVTIVPVADLLGQAIDAEHRALTKQYNNLPYCCNKISQVKRIHQLLYNEQVTILQELGDQVQIAIPNLFYTTGTNNRRNTIYWTLKKNVVPLSTLHGNARAAIPTPIQFAPTITPNNQTIATLTLSYYDPITQLHFSAGTRFVVTPMQPYPDKVLVYALDPKTLQAKRIPIARTHVIMHTQELNNQQKINLYLKILKIWAHQNDGFIPYVLGGNSMTQLCTQPRFSIHESADPSGKPMAIYEWPNCTPEEPKTGFDCTGLIARAAQIAGMPYYYKNSTTIASHLAALKPTEKLADGDLIWFAGHVIVISDIQNNTMIEARGYDHGFGKVHEIELKKVFKNITTYAQLVDAYHNKKPLERLNNKGMAVQVIPKFSLLKIGSIWSN